MGSPSRQRPSAAMTRTIAGAAFRPAGRPGSLGRPCELDDRRDCDGRDGDAEEEARSAAASKRGLLLMAGIWAPTREVAGRCLRAESHVPREVIHDNAPRASPLMSEGEGASIPRVIFGVNSPNRLGSEGVRPVTVWCPGSESQRVIGASRRHPRAL